jgi:hypothetical protein
MRRIYAYAPPAGGEGCMDRTTYMYIQAAARDARKERWPQATSGTMHLSLSWGERGQGRGFLLCMCRDTPLLRATPSAVAPIATDACKSATTRWMATHGRKERAEAYRYPGTRAAGQRTASLGGQSSPHAPSSKLNSRRHKRRQAS